MPRLVGRQVAEPHHELLHHPHRDRRQRHDVASHRLGPRQEIGVRHDLADVVSHTILGILPTEPTG